ncbi:SpoIIE family protein phosphatase [Streptomyces sp. NBC_01803]|uniref:SpoIIE family protein phosphatase n=1 Tax=Streptomyces sp. NBC_01803 TaxID=2975946 RepID=UPI003FA3758E
MAPQPAVPPTSRCRASAAGTTLTGGLPPVLRVPFAADETLPLVTDDVTEARDPDGAFPRLSDHLARGGDPAPGAVVARGEEAVVAHTRGRLADDTAILAVRRTTGGRVPQEAGGTRLRPCRATGAADTGRPRARARRSPFC